MVFTTPSFLAFFSIFFLLYWFVFAGKLKVQNLLLLAGSYIFYSLADWRFFPLIVGVSALNFFLGIWIEKSSKYKNLFLYLGLGQGIIFLLFFKYFNFSANSFNALFFAFNIKASISLLNLIVPLGISFYTFKAISYLLDIYKGKLKATTDWVSFFTYMVFFPTLLAGPIDRAITFIPQLQKKRTFDYELAVDGMRQILWGAFKKMVVADNCTLFTNDVFTNYQTLPGSSLFIGAIFYTIQIYADFSGYSDMAIGLSKLLGFRVTKNFEYPLFAQNIADFWRRWHISLTSWLTEYVFTPLSIVFRNLDKLGLTLAIIINFTLIGIWHGANWTYILFGFLHGCYYIPLIIKGTLNKKIKASKEKKMFDLPRIANIAQVFLLVTFTFILFRADTIAQAVDYYKSMFSKSLFIVPILKEIRPLATGFAFMLVMLVVEWFQQKKEHGLQIAINNQAVRLGIYFSLIFVIIFCSTNDVNPFIYFKF